MKNNLMRFFAYIIIIALLLQSSPSQALPISRGMETVPESIESIADPVELAEVPEGLTSSEWQSISEQIRADLSQQAYLKASNTDIWDIFGHSVAISGDTIVIGAYGEDSSATGVNGDQGNSGSSYAGAAYVFVRSGTSWVQQSYLKASNTENDEFGCSVAITGDTIVVGARAEDSSAMGVNGVQDDNNAESSGAAYVFVRSGTSWAQQAYLKASNSEEGDTFGSKVAIDGDTIVVGAVREDSSATGVNEDQSDNSATWSGAAYVFVRSGSSWAQQAYLKASNTERMDLFGESIAISGDTIVIGAENESSSAMGVNGDQVNNNAVYAGAAYVFVRSGTNWAQQAYLKASNTGSSDFFGASVGISGDTIVVGARNEDSSATGVNGEQADNSAGGAGAAYVFVRSGTSWAQQAYLKASNTGRDDYFGHSVAISGDMIVVGAEEEDSSATGVSGDEANNDATNAGAAYVFVRNGMSWAQQAYLKASNTDAEDIFGYPVAISGDTIVIGTQREDSSATGVNGDQSDNSAFWAGAAYVFAGESTPISYQQKYLFVPLNWEGTQSEFEGIVNAQINIFLGEVPLANCRDQVLVEILSVDTQNFDSFTCSDHLLADIRNFVRDETEYDPDDWDVVIGLSETSPCPPTAGRSNSVNTIWVTGLSDIITAHELGHIYGLSDQYCSTQAGSTDPRCNDGDEDNDGYLIGDPNYLDYNLPCDCPPDGSDDSTGSKCCNYSSSANCLLINYGVCCLGNKNSSGGRSTMSFADAPGPRGFDEHELFWLGLNPKLQCAENSRFTETRTEMIPGEIPGFIFDVNLNLFDDDSVEEEYIAVSPGVATDSSILERLSGEYHLKILDKDDNELIDQSFSVYFDYSGPIFDGVDYSTITFNAQDISFRFPYSILMDKLYLYHNEELLYTIDVPTLFFSFLPFIKN